MSPFNGKGAEETNSADQFVVLDSTDLEALLEQFGNDDHSRVISEIMRQFHELSAARAERDKALFERHSIIIKAMSDIDKLSEERYKKFKEAVDRLDELVDKYNEKTVEIRDEKKKAQEERYAEREQEKKHHDDMMEKLNEIKSILQQRKNSRREKCLAIINIEPGYKWYILQRQRTDFDKAIASLLRKYAKKNPTVVKKWYGIPENVNVGESLKLRLGHGSSDDDDDGGGNLRWLSRGNILSVVHRGEAGPFYTNETILQETEAILRANEKIEVSNEIDEIMNSI